MSYGCEIKFYLPSRLKYGWLKHLALAPTPHKVFFFLGGGVIWK